MRARVVLWEPGATRGPSKLIAIIEDAAELGFSVIANGAGQAFFTLPYSHWAHSSILCAQTHIQIQRQSSIGAAWTTEWNGLIDDHDTGPYDTVYKCSDYLSLFDEDQTELRTLYTGQACSTILQSEASAAINAANSCTGFIGLGSIETTATTATFMSDWQSRLMLMQQAALIVQQGSSAKPVFSINRVSDTSFQFVFDADAGARHPEVELRFPEVVSGFRLLGGYRNLGTTVRGVAQARGGAAALYSSQNGASAVTYGRRVRSATYGVLPDQASLDKMVLSDAVHGAQVNRDLALAIRSGALAPSDVQIGWSCPTTIIRGRANLDHAYYTIMGKTWYGHGNGTEELLLPVLPEDGGIAFSAPPPPLETPPPATQPPATTTPPTPAPSQPTYRALYTVKGGDTLISIARAYGTSYSAIQNATNANVGKISGVVAIPNASSIRTGQVVVIP